jgi:hypothetical protein
LEALILICGRAEGYGPAYDSEHITASFSEISWKEEPNLKPEIKTEAEFGADLEFFNRIPMQHITQMKLKHLLCRCTLKRFPLTVASTETSLAVLFKQEFGDCLMLYYHQTLQ